MSVVEVCRDTGGIQAQVLSSAEIALWTRRRQTTREEIQQALWQRHDLVRTSCMRLTLHLISARDFSMYIAAMKPSSTAILQRIFTRIGAKPAHVRAMIDTVVDALSDGPKTQQELIARARARAGKGMRAWLQYAWSATRPAVIEGLICCGPPKGSEATFVRADQWLPKQRTYDPQEARAELLRRFLSAFGPATPRDFAKWSGLKASEAKALLDALGDEIVPVSVDGASSWLLRRDVPALARSELDSTSGESLRLLPAFDSLLLAHATKEHLVEPRYYKRVYRPQGWISPVVLLGGKIVGVWFPNTKRRPATLDVDLFGKVGASVRRGIEREVEALGRFVGLEYDARIT